MRAERIQPDGLGGTDTIGEDLGPTLAENGPTGRQLDLPHLPANGTLVQHEGG